MPTTFFVRWSAPAKRLWLVKEAGHNDLICYTNKAWWREVMEFVGGKGQG